MRYYLQKKYNLLRGMCCLNILKNSQDINSIIKEAISTFLAQCCRPAIWCYGKHTKILMSDFMFELKKIHYIIDNGIKNMENSGFEILNESNIEEKQIDGIIISSWVYKDEIKNNLRTNYSHIRYLDIYEELEKFGIRLEESYYAIGHPYVRYSNLNKMQRRLFQEKDLDEYEKEIKKIIAMYIDIKDFHSAIKYTRRLLELADNTESKNLLEQLEDIYKLQMDMLRKIDENNVLMLCIDGLRRKEVSEGYLENLYDFMENKTYSFTNAYSVSTSTFESLIPAYSENNDLRTKYYKTNVVLHNNCRFINEAKRQERKIYFYTDGTAYIEDVLISVKSQVQTATEKLWDFMLDAVDEKNGLFYIHILHESHYSYPNPYTTDEIIAEGTHIMFDYLEHNGGEIRTDYDKQQKDSLKYLDDVIVPLIRNLKCRMVLYADHGNILIDKGAHLESVHKTKYTFHEDLIQVPFVIKSPEMGVGKDDILISIMELNNILIGLMNKSRILLRRNEFIKVVRSEIYNPDFRYLYRITNNEKGLLAFEVFLFEKGYKLAIYADGTVELYLAKTDYEVHDIYIEKRLLEKIKDKITVCNIQNIKRES